MNSIFAVILSLFLLMGLSATAFFKSLSESETTSMRTDHMKAKLIIDSNVDSGRRFLRNHLSSMKNALTAAELDLLLTRLNGQGDRPFADPIEILNDPTLFLGSSSLPINTWVGLDQVNITTNEYNDSQQLKFEFSASEPIFTEWPFRAVEISFEYRIRARMETGIEGVDRGRFRIILAARTPLTRWALANMEHLNVRVQPFALPGRYVNSSCNQSIPRTVIHGDVYSRDFIMALGDPFVAGKLFVNRSCLDMWSDEACSAYGSVPGAEFLFNHQLINRRPSGFGGTATFKGGAESLDAEIQYPRHTQHFNMIRLAVGEPCHGVACDDDPQDPAFQELAPNTFDASTEPDQAVINTYLREQMQSYVGGELSINESDLDTGIYFPTEAGQPKGGVYVHGDLSKLSLDVLSAEDIQSLESEAWTKMNSSENVSGCRFQRIELKLEDDQSTTSAPDKQVIYLALKENSYPEDPSVSCLGESTVFVFSETQGNESFEVMSSNLFSEERDFAQIFVNGEINSLGQSQSEGAALAKGLQLNIGAQKQVKLSNHLQYEDAFYFKLDTELASAKQEVVSRPTEDGVHLNPATDIETAENTTIISPGIPQNSKTLMGIVSVNDNVLISENAPNNLNLHASLYAGGQSCERAAGPGLSINGCGVGVENLDVNSGDYKGKFRSFGSIVQRRSQVMNLRQGCTFVGYTPVYRWDQRLAEMELPGFPRSQNTGLAVVEFDPVGAWELSSELVNYQHHTENN